MKKTSNTKNNSRPSGVRNAQLSKNNSKRPTTTKKSKKKSSKKKTPIYIAAAVAVIAVAAIVGIIIAGSGMGKLKNKSEKKYTIVNSEGVTLTNPDGSPMELTEAELRAAFAGDTFPQGIIINGIDVSGKTKDEARALIQAQDTTSAAELSGITIDVNLELDGKLLPIDATNFELASNMDEILDEAMNKVTPPADASVEVLIAYYATLQEIKTTPAVYTTAYTVKTDNISTTVHGMLDNLSNEAVDATVTGFNTNTLQFTYTDSSNGYVIDIDKAVDDVKALFDSGVYTGTIAVDADITEPALTTAMLQNEFGLIASSTSDTTTNNNRNHNIKITCEKIDGLVLQPGETFSFNGFIGQRTAAAGYLEAGTIQGNKIEQDFGGGICQVSSMIYQSVIKSDLKIEERHPHRWPSTYAVAGTDAAVDWGSQDFSFTNNTEYPIALHAVYDNDNYKITVAVYGHQFPDGQYIDFVGETISTTPAGTTYVANDDLPVGSTNTTSGHNGVTAKAYQIWYDANGNEIKKVELENTYYATIPTTIEVGTLNPDGTHATLDTSTGELSGVSETTTSEETTESSETEATVDTTAATEATTAATETPAPETEATTPAPETEATVPETEAA